MADWSIDYLLSIIGLLVGAPFFKHLLNFNELSLLGKWVNIIALAIAMGGVITQFVRACRELHQDIKQRRDDARQKKLNGYFHSYN